MRLYRAEESARMQALDGVELAGFWSRAGALAVDGLFGFLLTALLAVAAAQAFGKASFHTPFFYVQSTRDNQAQQVEAETPSEHPKQGVTVDTAKAKEIVTGVLPLILYFGLALYFGNGRTPGKWLFKIRVVSLVHERMTLWHSIERALGYGAAALEGGFGFIQFFIHPQRRTVQDRIAETIVVNEPSYRKITGGSSVLLEPSTPT